jgi:hypothetical protein
MTNFLEVTKIGQKNRISSLEDNIKSFLDWSFLNIGAYINVSIPTSGISGSNFHQLKPVTDPSNAIKVWESVRKDWVYESGIANQSPVRISGIYLNGAFLPSPSGSGSYTYSLNYPLGRVTFNNPVSLSSTVQLNYSYRYVQVYKSSEANWWKEIQQSTYNPAAFKANGDSSITANHRIQLPAIIIELSPRTQQIPRQLGTTQNIIIQDVLLHILAENPVQRNNLIDILMLQKDKTSYMYDVNKVVENNVYGVNYKGEINNSGLNYNQIVANPEYQEYYTYIKDAYLSEVNSLSSNLHNGVVRWSVEMYP